MSCLNLGLARSLDVVAVEWYFRDNNLLEILGSNVSTHPSHWTLIGLVIKAALTPCNLIHSINRYCLSSLLCSSHGTVTVGFLLLVLNDLLNYKIVTMNNCFYVDGV